MSTPSQHRTTAEAYIARLTNYTGSTLSANDADQLIATAHAILATKVGTGTHYTDAETALAAASSAQTFPLQLANGRLAVINAQLAD